MQSIKGFTLIELIVVIILLSIVSALGIGLFGAPSSYTARLSSDQWLSQLRLSQRMSLVKQSASELIALSVTDSGSQWVLDLQQGATSIGVQSIDKEDVVLRGSTSDFSGPCAGLPALPLPITWYFDGYGDRVNAARIPINTNQRLCFDGNQDVDICIAPSGYAYRGACDD